MHGGGESSDCIVPAKCANKGGEPSAERMEGRRSAKEILEYWADAGHRARQYRQLQYAGSACGPGTGRACLSPKWEPCALEARARVCAGGGGQSSSLPRPAALPGGVALDRSTNSCPHFWHRVCYLIVDEDCAGRAAIRECASEILWRLRAGWILSY